MVQKSVNTRTYAESMLKGRMAETLFEELMRQSDNIVYRFGYEAIVQNLTQLEEKFDRYSKVGERIRAIPDFIVIDRRGNPEFVEVKFRWDGRLDSNRDKQRLANLLKYWEAKFIVVNCSEQPYFRISDPPYMGKNGNFVWKPLVDEAGWKIDPKIYREYEELVHRYLTPTRIPPMSA